MSGFNSSQSRRSLPKPLAAVILAALLFVLVEAALQTRSHIRFGQSILNQIQGVSPYIFDPAVGVTLLRPNHLSGGGKQEIKSNSVGLRSPEIAELKPPGVIRVAVLGASTVMGAYAASNDVTFPALLQRDLRELLKTDDIEVINAGIAGLSVGQQQLLYERLLARYSPDLTVVYPGFNDFGVYCRAQSKAQRWRPQPLAGIELPAWLLSVDLLLKNSVAIRTLPQGLKPLVDADALDMEPYRERIRALLTSLKVSGTRVLIARNARSYRPDQPLEQQLELSSTARFFNPCFDIDGLHRLYDLHNGAIEVEAMRLGVEVLPLDAVVPGGRQYFVDASHFSEEGERLVAGWIAHHIEPWLRERKGAAQ
jgi:lysophospholipase L1-like esterase